MQRRTRLAYVASCSPSKTLTTSLPATPVGFATLAANDNQVVLTAVVEFAWAATTAGIAIGLYPALRRHNRGLALGAAASRAAEGVLILVGALSLLALLSLSQEAVATCPADVTSARVSANLLVAAREWVHGFVMALAAAFTGRHIRPQVTDHDRPVCVKVALRLNSPIR